MKDKNLVINKETYGLLIQSLTHRNILLEAIKLVEEAADKQILISNRRITKLRNRFDNLELKNDAIPVDPELWVELKDILKIGRIAYRISLKYVVDINILIRPSELCARTRVCVFLMFYGCCGRA